MAMLAIDKTHDPSFPDSVFLAGEAKKEEYAKKRRGTCYRERSELRQDRAYDCGCNSGSPLKDAVGSLEKELIRYRNRIVPEPGQLSDQLHKPICLTACKMTKHTVRRWYRTVYIP